MAETGPPQVAGAPEARDRLESWKEIAAYLGRSVRTVERWEADEGLPVHRVHGSLARVFALKPELDAWWRDRRSLLDQEARAATAPSRRWKRVGLVAVLGVALATAAGYVSRSARRAAAAPLRLAVLPFLNLSGDPDQEYLSDGMTEETITALARLSPQRLVVIGRTSVMGLKRTEKSLREIGRDLAVDHVLEGSVRRAGDRVRVTAQLVRVNDEAHLWAQSYDRAFGDLLTIQADVAQGVGEQVAAHLTPEASAGDLSRTVTRAASPEVYDLYLRGRFHLDKLTRDDTRRGLTLLREATEKEPAFAPAFAALARGYMVADGWTMPAREGWPLAKAAAQRAIELDEKLPDALISMAQINECLEWDPAGAKKLLTRAVELDPGHAGARLRLGTSSVLFGEVEEGLAQMRLAVEQDPLSAYSRLGLATFYAWLGRSHSAGEECRQLEELHPETHFAHVCLGAVHELAGEYDAAAARYLAAGEIGRTLLARAYALSGRKPEARQLLGELEAVWERGEGAGTATNIARVHVALGEKDAALLWLERAWNEHDPGLGGVGVDPAFASLRRAPRFRDLKRRIGLPD